jgi:hypothetical protein
MSQHARRLRDSSPLDYPLRVLRTGATPLLAALTAVTLLAACSLPSHEYQTVTLKEYRFGDVSHAHADRYEPVMIVWASQKAYDDCESAMIESQVRSQAALAAADPDSAQRQQEKMEKAFRGQLEACTRGYKAVLYHGDRVALLEPATSCGTLAHIRVVDSRYTTTHEDAVVGCAERESLSHNPGPMQPGYWRLAAPSADPAAAGAAHRVAVGAPADTLLACLSAQAALVADQRQRVSAGAAGAEDELQRLQLSTCVHDSPELSQ